MLKEHCIIHIGMHKTGTTSIQSTFSRYLEDDMIHYVKLEQANHSLPISSLFNDSGKLHHIHIRNGWSIEKVKQYNNQVRKMLEDEFLDNSLQTMLISGEGISILSYSSLERFKKFLENFFRKITIVAYIRPPKSFMQSAFQQHLREGMPEFKLRYPQYRKRFERFEQIFGKENVHFWKFDPASFAKGDVVLDFCKRLNVTVEEKNIIKTNESLSKEAVQLLYLYKKYRQKYGIKATSVKENQNIIGHLRKIGNSKFSFSPDLIRPILKKNTEDIAWMEEHLEESLSENILELPSDIECENSLLKISDRTVEELKKILYGQFPSSKNFYKDVANAVDCLRFAKTVK